MESNEHLLERFGSMFNSFERAMRLYDARKNCMLNERVEIIPGPINIGTSIQNNLRFEQKSAENVFMPFY